MALNALGLPPRASVAVPLYCCPVVFKAIRAAGFRARFIDVDPATYCLSVTDLAAKSSEVDAVIAVHMFGNLCDMPRLREAAPGKPFIEDCAQALGSRLNGRPAGKFGEIAVFSFRSGKYLSVGEGGALHCVRDDLHSQLAALMNESHVPGRWEEWVHVAATWLRSALRTMPLWGMLGAQLWDTYSRKVSYTSQSPLVLGRIYETDRDMAVRRFPHLASWIEKQRSHAVSYANTLKVEAGMLCPEPSGAFFNRLQYPILPPTAEQSDRLVACLSRDQISTSRPYRDIASVAAAHYGYAGDCPQSERVASAVLVIPCHYALETTDIERIAASVNRAWHRIGGAPPGAPLASPGGIDTKKADHTAPSRQGETVGVAGRA